MREDFQVTGNWPRPARMQLEQLELSESKSMERHPTQVVKILEYLTNHHNISDINNNHIEHMEKTWKYF